MKSSFVFRTPPLSCTLWWCASVGVWLYWMMTSTVAPLGPLFRASRSCDTLCFLPSARDRLGARRTKSASSTRLRMSLRLRIGFILVFTLNGHVDALHGVLRARAPDRAGAPHSSEALVRACTPNRAGAPDRAGTPHRTGAPDCAGTEDQVNVAVTRIVGCGGRQRVAGGYIRTGQRGSEV